MVFRYPIKIIENCEKLPPLTIEVLKWNVRISNVIVGIDQFHEYAN